MTLIKFLRINVWSIKIIKIIVFIESIILFRVSHFENTVVHLLHAVFCNIFQIFTFWRHVLFLGLDTAIMKFGNALNLVVNSHNIVNLLDAVD